MYVLVCTRECGAGRIGIRAKHVIIKTYRSYNDTTYVYFSSSSEVVTLSKIALNRLSNMSVHVLLNLLNELRMKIKCEVLPSTLSFLHDKF